MYRTDVVAHAGLGGFPAEARLTADPRNATLGLRGATVKHVVVGFLLIFLPGLLVLWLLLH
jgi:hypothetical protein